MRQLLLSLLCGLSSTAALAQWQPVSTPTGMGTEVVYGQLDAIDGQTAWVINNSLPPYNIRIWRTTDGGQSWQSTIPTAPANAQFTNGVLEALDAQHAWVLMQYTNSTQTELHYTADGGQTWTRQVQLYGGCNAGQLRFFNPTDGLMLSGIGGPMLRTTNGGRTWQSIPGPTLRPGEHLGELQQAPGLLWSTVFTQFDQPVGLCLSTDQGQTWRLQALPTDALGGPVFRDALHALLPTSQGGMRATADGGQTWTPTGRPTFQLGLFGSLVAVPGSRTYVAGAHAITGIASARGSAISTDDGQTWTPLETTNSYLTIRFTAPDAGWYVRAEVFNGMRYQYLYQAVGRYAGPTLVTASAPARAAVPADVFPNPSADGHFTLRLPATSRVRSVRVLDALGRPVYQSPSLPADQRLDLSRQPKGLYALEIQTDAGLVRRKLVWQ